MNLFITIRWLDVLDVLLVGILLYQLYQIVKGTVAIRIFAGILAIYLLWKVVEALKMELLSEILGQFIGVGVIALIIVFQQELRRFLIIIGTTGFFRDKSVAKRLFQWKWNQEKGILTDIKEVVKSCFNMAEKKTGALIVIKRTSNLDFYITSGEEVDALLSSDLLESIFFKNNPLHDGAVIIEENRIKAARCVLPVSERKDIPSQFGMRHRAAIGITEASDAISIVVSEQTGQISYAREGFLHTDLSTEELREKLEQDLR